MLINPMSFNFTYQRFRSLTQRGAADLRHGFTLSDGFMFHDPVTGVVAVKQRQQLLMNTHFYWRVHVVFFLKNKTSRLILSPRVSVFFLLFIFVQPGIRDFHDVGQAIPRRHAAGPP